MPAAIYARYSTSEQRVTSIEDQVRRCLVTAEKMGIKVDDDHCYADAAVSGAEKGIGKRDQFMKLTEAIDSRIVDVLIIDSVPRVSRTMLEGAELAAKVKSIGLRIVTADGLDSNNPNFEVLWGFMLLTASQQVQETAEQVGRGMLGQLKRGFQIARPPFGYQGRRVTADGDRELGTIWEIVDSEAEVVRQMYALRSSGMSVTKIAEKLNTSKILPPCPARSSHTPFWRPSAVFRMLQNPIYRGVFVWHDSLFSKALAKRRRKKLVPQEFPRPDLRLVSDSIWQACNTKDVQTKIRGGGNQPLAGLLRCGHCHARLSINGSTKTKSAHCGQCDIAKRVGGHANFIGYSSIFAANLALNWALKQVFSPEMMDEFRRRLEKRLMQGTAEEESDLLRRLQQAEQKLQRLLRLIADPTIDEDELRTMVAEAMADKKEMQSKLNVLKKRSAQVTKSAIEMQSSVDPLPLIQRLVEGEPTVYQVRVTLKRLLSRFELVAKTGRNCSVFELSFIPGVGIAEVSGTPVIDQECVSYRVTVSTGARRPVVWTIFGERI